MEVFEFLKHRTQFISFHYETASMPFLEIQRKIEAEEAPYQPSFCEDGEPQFLSEWMDAGTSLNVIGAGCVSMLSETLKLLRRQGFWNRWLDDLEERSAHLFVDLKRLDCGIANAVV